MKKSPITGHASHTHAADDPQGLTGKVRGPIKITMMGAGSFFTSSLMNDVLRIPGAEHGHIALVDIDAKRLKVTHGLIANLIRHLGKEHWKVTSTTRRREALPGSNYIVNCIEVSGTACVRFDNDIPLKYGVDQCIGDTTGPGGLFKGLRTIPVFLQVLKDAEELCPKALVLNYTNPMSMMCLAAGRASSMQVVGLCHSVQGTSHLLAGRAGIPYEELNFECAGVNHLAWFTRLEHKGQDLYPKLKAMARQDLAGKPSNKNDAWDRVRKELMLQFGAFTTEGSGHNSEYLPYFRHRKDTMKAYCGTGYEGGSRFYALNWPRWRKEVDKRRLRILQGKESIDYKRSWEYASWIIEAHQKDVPYRIYGNVMNSKDGSGPMISNLPSDGCVELSCTVDGQGIHPTRYGRLPAQMAGICDSNMRMFDLGAQAAIDLSREMAVHALMLDPLTSAVCSLREIRKMTDELFKFEKPYLANYR